MITIKIFFCVSDVLGIYTQALTPDLWRRIAVFSRAPTRARYALQGGLRLEFIYSSHYYNIAMSFIVAAKIMIFIVIFM